MDLYNLILSAKITKGGGGDEPVLIDKTITENGTYNASSDSADGYKKIAVDVPSVAPTGNINITSTAQTDVSAYATAQVVDADLVASNIKKDVDILGVVGTYEGGGGGGSGITPAVEKTYNVTTTSTSAIDIDNILIPLEEIENKWTLIIIEDTNGPRDGYFYAWSNLRFNGKGLAGNYFNNTNATGFNTSSASQNGVFANITSNGTDEKYSIKAKYNSSNVGAIDGIFKVRIFIF